jgi:hypothetical protein
MRRRPSPSSFPLVQESVIHSSIVPILMETLTQTHWTVITEIFHILKPQEREQDTYFEYNPRRQLICLTGGHFPELISLSSFSLSLSQTTYETNGRLTMHSVGEAPPPPKEEYYKNSSCAPGVQAKIIFKGNYGISFDDDD